MPSAPTTRALRRRRATRRRRFVATLIALIIIVALAVGVVGFVRSLNEHSQPSNSSAAEHQNSTAQISQAP